MTLLPVAVAVAVAGVAQLGQLLVVLGGIVAVDLAVARVGHGVDGALALLEAARRDFGGVCEGCQLNILLGMGIRWWGLGLAWWEARSA